MVSVRSSVRDTQGRSRVPELGPLGSMRGASSNGRPYRERQAKKAFPQKGFLLFLTPSALSVTVSADHAVANGRETPDSGRCRSDSWRPLDGENAP